MKTVSDVVVVGGGPVGSFAAWILSKLGVETTVFEEHTEIGLPSHCAGHISIRGLRSLKLLPLPHGILENTFSTANFHSPFGATFSVHLKRPVTCALNRELFDKLIAKKAEEAGVKYMLTSKVNSLEINSGFVEGVNVAQSGGTQLVTAKTVIDAEGVSSRLLRETGLRGLNREGIVLAVEAEVEKVKNMDMDAVEVFLGRDYAPGLYAWIIPRLDGTAKVGLAARKGNPKELLHRLMFKHPVASKLLNQSHILKTAYHPITLGGPISKAYANGFLAVGDVASQVKPTTGGGVILGLTCAKIAAETACEAIRLNEFGASFLKKYQKRVSDELGFDASVMLKIRRLLDSLSDEKTDSALRFCKRIGLDKSFENVDEIDFQGKLLLQTVKKPATTAALAYFLLLSLSENP